MQYFTTDHHRLAYADRGNRAPLLFVHGFPLDHTMWAPQLDAFAPVRRVIAPDLMGFGASDMGAHETVDAHADDLAALLDTLGLPRAVVVAFSMGGYVALAFWRRHAARVAGLVLADTRATPDTDAARAGRQQTAMAVAEHGARVVAEGMLPKLLSSDAAPSLIDEVASTMARQTSGGVIGGLRAMATRPDSSGDLPSIDVPTLIVVGEQDAITPVADSQAMASAIAGSQLVVLPGAGHLANLEQPGAFNAALRSFLERVDGS